MGVAGFFKKVKNAVTTVANKIGSGIKKAATAVVNTGAKVISKVADVASDVASVVAPVGTLMSFIPGPVGVAGKVISGVGNLVKYGGKGVEWLANKVDDAIPDNSSNTITPIGSSFIKDNSSNPITNNSVHTILPIDRSKLIRDYPNPIQQRTDRLRQQLTSNQDYYARQLKGRGNPTLRSQPDVFVNNSYNRGARRDYVQQRHPSNPSYNVRNIGPRRLNQPPIIDNQNPMDIQRRNYHMSKNVNLARARGHPRNVTVNNYYGTNPNSNAATSW